MEDTASYGNPLIFVKITLRGYVEIKVKVFTSCLLSGLLLGHMPDGLAIESGHIVDQISSEEKVSVISDKYLQGKYSEVFNTSKAFLKFDPSNELVRNLYSMSCFKLKNYNCIIDFYTEQEAEYLKSPLQLKLRSIAQAKEGNYYSALIALQALNETGRQGAEWKSFYHYLVYKINPNSSFKELSRLNQGSPSIANDLNTGKLHLLDGKYDRAAISFQAALSKDYLNTEALEILGDSYFQMKNFDKSLAAYLSLLKITPNNSTVIIKIGKVYFKLGLYFDAIKALEKGTSDEAKNLKAKITSFANHAFNNHSSRSIAAEKTQLDTMVTVYGKANLEESFIPTPEIDIYMDSKAKSLNSEKLGSVVVSSTNGELSFVNATKSSSTLELGIGLKAKKYNLYGTGFNAKIDYSTGVALNVKYSFFSSDKKWNTNFDLYHSKTSFDDLAGLTPQKIILNETKTTLGFNYMLRSFSLGPIIMYESMSSTQTSPSTVRGNVNFFNIGVRAAQLLNISEHTKLKLEADYYSKIVSTSKTLLVGNVDKRNSLGFSGKFYFEMRPNAYYFAGVGYSKMDTKYSASAARGTSQAIERERDFSFPVGIDYAF